MIRLRIFIKIMQIYFWEHNLRNVIMIYILGRVLLAAIFILFFSRWLCNFYFLSYHEDMEMMINVVIVL